MTTQNGSIPTIASGDTTTVPTNLATYRDALKAITEARSTYTATWTGSGGNPTIGNGVNTGRYWQATKEVDVRIAIHAGTTTTVGTGTYTFALPVAAHATGEQVLKADFYDGANHYAAAAYIAAGASTCSVFSTKGGASGSMVQLGSTSFAAGTLAIIAVNGTYEGA